MTTFRTNRAPIIIEIPSDTTEAQKPFFKWLQTAIAENYRATRQDLDSVDDAIGTYNKEITKAAKHHCICDVWYKDADEIIIKPKYINGSPLLSGYFSDKSYLEQTTAITAKLAVPASSGHIVDGLTAVLNDQWYILWLYNNAGAIAPAFTPMPITTFSNANPTNALTLNQINAQDIGYLFPAGAHVVVWQDGNEFETPYFFSQDGGATTVDATADKPKISSRTATALTLGDNLTNATFTAGSYVYQVDNFQPLRLSDGANAFGTSGYMDTGIRLRTDASGNILPFVIIGNEFYYCNGNYSWDNGLFSLSMTGSWVNFRTLGVPADKCGIYLFSRSTTTDIYTKPYYMAYGEVIGDVTYSLLVRSESRQLHGILSANASNGVFAFSRGYII